MFTTAAAVLDRVKMLLEADATFAGVKVYTAAVDPSQDSEFLVLGHTVTGSGEQETFGKRAATRRDDFSLECALVVFKTGGQTLEAAATAARDRATALMDAIETVIATDPKLDGLPADVGAKDIYTFVSRTSWQFEQNGLDRSRYCAVSFNIDVRALL